MEFGVAGCQSTSLMGPSGRVWGSRLATYRARWNEFGAVGLQPTGLVIQPEGLVGQLASLVGPIEPGNQQVVWV